MQQKISAFFVSLILLLIFLVFSTAVAAETLLPKVRETSLGRLPKGYQLIPDSIKMSPDLKNLAYAAYSDNTHNIIRVNNQSSPVYYAIQPGSPIFSPELNRHAYIAHKGPNQSVLVVDGKIIDTVDNADHFMFSPNGSRYACRAQKNKQQYVIMDGVPGPMYSGIPVKDNFFFSPDSRRFIYVALKNNACVAVVDGKEEPLTFNFIQTVRFSPDSTQYAYKARTEKKPNGQEKWCAVINGKAGYVYDKIFDFIFSYDSKSIAFAAYRDKKMMMVVNGKELEVHDLVGVPVFSFDSKTLAYAFAKNQRWYIMNGNEEEGPFDQIYRFYFSPNSKRSALFAKKGDNWFCMVDGDKGPKFEKTVESFKFSLDSSRYVYAGVDEDGGQIITDGNPGKTYLSVGEPYFSLDSKHTVYRALLSEKKWITILNDREYGKKYHGIGKYEFSFDSKHLSFPAFISINQSVMVVDGVEECADHNFKILGAPTFGPDGNYIVYHARAAEEKWHLIVNGRVLPETYGGFFKGTPIIFDSPTHFHTLGIRPGGTEFVVIDVDIPETWKLTSRIETL